MSIDDKDLIEIYGTITDLENKCISTNICWEDYEQYKLGYEQTPYLPYFGKKYIDVLFCGINLNEGNTDTNAIFELVEEAKLYIQDHKYKIFKQEGYGGSNFYYYVPLLSYMYKSIIFDNKTFKIEDDISWENIFEGFEFCSITNLIKCSVSSPDKRSRPSDQMYYNCIPKLKIEISKFNPKTIFFFNKFLYPNMLEHYFEGYRNIIKKDRYSISDYRGIKIIELEHPMSTAITREFKFSNYNEAINDLKSIVK